jgi:Activator of Hsp90 ATPase homolog 1-like protein
MTISLEDVADGTAVVGLHEGIPPGIDLADNELGWQSALSRLAALVER